MTQGNQGFTVGELTITIGILIIAGLIWSNIVKRQNPNQSLEMQYKSEFIVSINQDLSLINKVEYPLQRL